MFSSSVVNEANIGVNRIHITFTPNNTTDPGSLGLASTLGPNEKFMPTISIGGLGLLFGDERIRKRDLVVPHTRIAERPFVRESLKELGVQLGRAFVKR